MEKKSLEKLAGDLNLKPLHDECVVLNDDMAEEIYGGWWDTYNNCPTYNNCKP